MRKCYVVIGCHTDKDGYFTWVSGVKSSWNKAVKMCENLKAQRPENEYSIQVELID